MFSFTKEKSDLNKATRGKGFEEAEELFYGPFKEVAQIRNGERRTQIYGWLGDEEWVGVFAFDRDPPRVVSLRRAKRKERKIYYGQDEEGTSS